MTRGAPPPPVLRFAPSPNGPLHLGHALSALTNFEMAQRLGGRFLLRIEDIDGPRTREDFVSGIFEDLAWLGLSWEEPVLRQSRHLADYGAAAQRLADMGVLYPCFASRKEVAEAGDPDLLDPDGALIYPGLWKGAPPDRVAQRLQAGEPCALRLDMERARARAHEKLHGRPLTFTSLDTCGAMSTEVCAPERWGDVVVVRKDVPASYLLAVVIDDARQGITHVVRGMDLYAATGTQRLLQVLLDLPEPLYHHHRLVTDAHGLKLSKSTGAAGLAALRAAGESMVDVRRRLGF